MNKGVRLIQGWSWANNNKYSCVVKGQGGLTGRWYSSRHGEEIKECDQEAEESRGSRFGKGHGHAPPPKINKEKIREVYSRLNAEQKAVVQRILRVDHAGELGADRIYAGQLSVLGGNPQVGPVIREMWEQEKGHLDTFEKMIPEYRVRPTVLHPIWSAAGFALGAGTAMMGKEAAMACTIAVETVIGEHYDAQLRALMKMDPQDEQLLKTIAQFRDEELEHRETGVEYDGEQAPLYQALSNTIMTGCRAAIWLAERV
eukprot:Nk52_evm23s2531 gene=Nk52_evmTU23s2531